MRFQSSKVLPWQPAALSGRDDPIGRNAIMELMTAVDTYIPQPDRPVDKPFLMPIEDVLDSGRGTVVTYSVETGIIKVGEEVEIVGAIKAAQPKRQQPLSLRR